MTSTKRRTKLSVNVDHIATLRQARGVDYPDPVEAARLAEGAGASGITVHLRGDRRHILERDVAELRRTVSGKLNLEMAATDEMITIALDLRPDQVTLVPERPDEVTTEGGLDLLDPGATLRESVERLAAAGIALSVFLDPVPDQVDAAAGLASGIVDGFEINTDAYTRAGDDARAAELDRIGVAAALGGERGLRVYAGHGLTVANVGAVAAMAEIEELNIGHSIVARASLVGMTAAVEEMIAAILAGEQRG